MTSATRLLAVIALFLLAGCQKSEPETGAAPAHDSTMAGDRMGHDSTMMGHDSSHMMMDSTMKDSSMMMMDSTKMMSDSSMQMPADSAK